MKKDGNRIVKGRPTVWKEIFRIRQSSKGKTEEEKWRECSEVFKENGFQSSISTLKSVYKWTLAREIYIRGYSTTDIGHILNTPAGRVTLSVNDVLPSMEWRPKRNEFFPVTNPEKWDKELKLALTDFKVAEGKSNLYDMTVIYYEEVGKLLNMAQILRYAKKNRIGAEPAFKHYNEMLANYPIKDGSGKSFTVGTYRNVRRVSEQLGIPKEERVAQFNKMAKQSRVKFRAFYNRASRGEDVSMKR